MLKSIWFIYMLSYFVIQDVRFVSNIQQFTNFDQSTYWGVQPTLGLGVKLKNMQLDYAFTRLGDVKTS